MKYIIGLITVILLWTCQKNVPTDEISGDLYFGLFRIGSYYNQPDSIIQWYETYFDTTDFELESNNEQQLFSAYQKLKKHDLLYKPFVQLLIQEDSIIRLYLDEEDYAKIKVHKRKNLRAQNKKVIIRSQANQIDPGIYQCIDLTGIEVVNGQTLQKQRKFKIEDYN
jgi:hypothetical protein